MSEKEQQILVDHDNTLTQGEDERKLYLYEYIRIFADLFKKPLNDSYVLFEESEKEILEHPNRHLHRINGLIVGPETSDPFLLTLACARVTLKKLRENEPDKTASNRNEDNIIFSRIFAEAYPKSGVIYRHDAARVITDLHKTGRLTIVSGSPTNHVREKLSRLFAGSAVDVFSLDIRGNAGKSYVDLAQETHLPEFIRLKQFPYPIYLRKPIYANVLRSLPREPGVVVSDSYTYDLSLPEYLRMYTVLLETGFITKPEFDHYAHHPNGIRVLTLGGMRDAIDRFV